MFDDMQKSILKANIAVLAGECHRIATEHGFWESTNKGEKIALMHSELSECLEALRHGNPRDEHIPEFDNATVELADCIIRILDFARREGLRLPDAILAKMEYNEKRPRKHGKEF